jgi:hypothetical protein
LDWIIERLSATSDQDSFVGQYPAGGSLIRGIRVIRGETDPIENPNLNEIVDTGDPAESPSSHPASGRLDASSI